MRVFLLRHGESFSNADPERLALPEAQGDRLTPTGIEQARAAGRYLADAGLKRMITSTARRAAETAAEVSAETGLRAEVHEGIHELRESSGYEALPPEEQRLRRWSVWMGEHGHDPDYAPPGGESFNEVIARVRAFQRDLAAMPESPVLAVTHGIFLRFFLIHSLLGERFSAADVPRLWQLSTVNAGISVFAHGEPWQKDRGEDPEGWVCVSWMARPWERP
jgi:broad specificity phosphatase PhoE